MPNAVVCAMPSRIDEHLPDHSLVIGTIIESTHMVRELITHSLTCSGNKKWKGDGNCDDDNKCVMFLIQPYKRVTM